MNDKIHFGLIENYGSYEMPLYTCEKTLCGLDGEVPCEAATGNWDEVTCKKCLKLKETYKKGIEADEEILIQQMGEMATFMKVRE